MADYQSQFTGSEIDSRLAKVPQIESALEGKQATLVSGSNIKTINGQPVLGGGDMTIPAGGTDAVKYVSQTLTEAQKAQARANIDAASLADIADMDFVTAATLPTASASTMGHIYLIGPDANDNYDRYFTQQSGSTYSWVPLGSTQIGLSDYATKDEVTQLDRKVDYISETIDPTTYAIRRYSINASTLKYGTGSTYKHVSVPVGNYKKLIVTANSTGTAIIAFLVSDVTNNMTLDGAGGAVDIVPGTSIIEIPVGETREITIPQGTNLVFIYLGALENNAYLRVPASVVMLSTKDSAAVTDRATINSIIGSQEVDLSQLEIINCGVNISGNYTNATYCKHLEVPVKAGETLQVKTNKSFNCIVAQAPEEHIVGNSGTPANIIANTIQDIPGNTVATIPIVSGAKCLFVNLGDARTFGVGSLQPAQVIKTNIQQAESNEAIGELGASISGKLSIVGKGSDIVYDHFSAEIDEGSVYRIYVNKDVSMSGITPGDSYRFRVYYKDKDAVTIGYGPGILTKQELNSYYDFLTPKGCVAIMVGVRCESGVSFDMKLQKLAGEQPGIGSILQTNPEAEFLPKFMSAKKRYYTSSDTTEPSPLVILHLSDIHGNWDNVERYLSFADRYKDYIDVLVNTGDTVVNKFAEGIDGYAALNGIGKVWNIVGNHDTRGDTWQESIGVPVYNMLIKPFVSGWSVVQPANAEANGYCYYYKDFTEKSIRVVAVDVMGYDSTEDAWLDGVLADAKTNSLHVVILTHFSCPRPYEERTEGVFDVEPCNYSTLYPFGSDSTNLTGYNNNAYLMAETVNTFIEGGGYFVGYVQGHYHADFVAKGDKYPNQLIYSIGATKAGEMRDYDHVLNTRFQDEFQIIAIDTKNTIVKLFKVGANIDRYGRSKGGVCVDYSGGRIIGECFL